jgi:hypothetical protein
MFEKLILITNFKVLSEENEARLDSIGLERIKCYNYAFLVFDVGTGKAPAFLNVAMIAMACPCPRS